MWENLSFTRKIILIFFALTLSSHLAIYFFLLHGMGPFAYLLIITFSVMAAGAILIYALSNQMMQPLKEMILMGRAWLGEQKAEQVYSLSVDEVDNLSRLMNRIMQQSRASFAQMKSEKEEIAAILSTLVEHVIAVDMSGKVLYLNAVAEKLFNMNSAQAKGRGFVEVIRQAVLWDILRDCLQESKARFGEIRLYLPDERIFKVHALPLAGQNMSRGALLVLHDVTKIKELEAVRRNFVANVSHELRTPLTSIQGYAESLLSGALEDPKHNRNFVQTIYDQAERLTRLVEDILNLSSIESGRRKPNLEKISAGKLFPQIKEDLKLVALKMKVIIKLDPEAEKVELFADPEQIKQVLINLTENAIKFNRVGGWVSLRAQPYENEVQLLVEDSGIGIAKDDIDHIFERFYRVDKARSSESGGTGLGLSIVKHIIDSHQGKIEVQSALGQGSLFTISLPPCP